MAKTQDAFFEKYYYSPALKWAKANGFVKPLSMLVIYDSFIHSGSIREFLLKRFAATVPINGGNEDSWIRQYVDTRREWLARIKNRFCKRLCTEWTASSGRSNAVTGTSLRCPSTRMGSW